MNEDDLHTSKENKTEGRQEQAFGNGSYKGGDDVEELIIKTESKSISINDEQIVLEDIEINLNQQREFEQRNRFLQLRQIEIELKEKEFELQRKKIELQNEEIFSEVSKLRSLQNINQDNRMHYLGMLLAFISVISGLGFAAVGRNEIAFYLLGAGSTSGAYSTSAVRRSKDS